MIANILGKHANSVYLIHFRCIFTICSNRPKIYTYVGNQFSYSGVEVSQKIYIPTN